MTITFEEALKNLKDNKILSRSNWKMINKRIELNNNQFNAITEKSPENTSEKWVPDHEDILAEDWILIDPADIKKYHLSVNQLKSFGVSQESIDELENKNTNKAQDLIDKMFEGKVPDDLFKKATANLQKNIQIQQPMIPHFTINKDKI